MPLVVKSPAFAPGGEIPAVLARAEVVGTYEKRRCDARRRDVGAAR